MTPNSNPPFRIENRIEDSRRFTIKHDPLKEINLAQSGVRKTNPQREKNEVLKAAESERWVTMKKEKDKGKN